MSTRGQENLDGCYEPAIPIDMAEPQRAFDHEHFVNYMVHRFDVSEKVYEPLKDLLSLYDIKADEILGSGFQCNDEDRINMAASEEAKLTVLVREMSRTNKKWRARIKLGKGSMSAVLGSRAPSSSVAKRENDQMLRDYIFELKEGIPVSQRASAKLLLENASEQTFEGGKFEHLTSLMMKYVTEFLAGRQRELLVAQNKAQGWSDPYKGYAFWPEHVSPAYGAPAAVDIAKKAFLALLDITPPDAHKDMARVRLLKDYFLDSEGAYWEEMRSLYALLESELPDEIGRLDLQIESQDITHKVAQAFRINVSELPADLISQARCLVRLYALKHAPFEPDVDSTEKLDYLEKMQQPHYTSLAAVILYDLQTKRKSIKLEIPGETYTSVPVYKVFKNALRDAGVDLTLDVESNNQQLVSVLNTMDTKALNYILSLFSYASNADDGKSGFLRMDYVGEQAKAKVERAGLLAELPRLLKVYSCETAHFLMSTYTTSLRENTRNPLI